MCGIVGYIGDEQAAPILIKGLEKLKYRGYDSAGVCTNDGEKFKKKKKKGEIKVLQDSLGNSWRTLKDKCTSSFKQFGQICRCS